VIEKNMLLTDDDRVLLMRMRDLLEEITETLDIAEDEEALNSIEKAEEDIKTGRLRNYNDFVGELKRSDQI
jgi:CheY-like chemotaxis protein